jgi:hypothetical protein
MSSEQDALILSTARLVRAARALEPDYAGRFAPARSDQVARLLAGACCHVEVFPFRSRTVAMALPRCAGVYPVLVDRGSERTARVFALRHELGHVLAGDVDGAVFLADTGYMAPSERIADLFALADLVPGWWIEWVRAGGAPAQEVRSDVVQAVAEYAEDWPLRRLRDRAALRLRLFRAAGI